MAMHVLPPELEVRLTQFAGERQTSPDEVLTSVLNDFFAEYESDREAAELAKQRWDDYEAGKERTYTLAELMEEDGLGA
jgi:lipoate-protein ligase A